MWLKLLLIASALLVLTTALAGLAAWRFWRLLRRRLRVELRLRTVKVWVTPPGARREVAALRRELAEAVSAAPHAVTVVQRASGMVGDLPQLARRLQRVAATLDAELELLGGEPDPRELTRMPPSARARVADFAASTCGSSTPTSSRRWPPWPAALRPCWSSPPAAAAPRPAVSCPGLLAERARGTSCLSPLCEV